MFYSSAPQILLALFTASSVPLHKIIKQSDRNLRVTFNADFCFKAQVKTVDQFILFQVKKILKH